MNSPQETHDTVKAIFDYKEEEADYGLIIFTLLILGYLIFPLGFYLLAGIL